MHRTLNALAGAALLMAGLTACGPTAATKSSDKPPASSAAADSVAARCRAQHWPQPMPHLAGKSFDPLGKDLQCFDHLKALAPDGHDVMNDTAAGAQPWTVASSQPAQGTQVTLSTPIVLRLRAPGTASTKSTASPTPSHTATHKPANRQPAPVKTTHHATVPAVDDHGGATAKCNDGTLSYSAHHQGTCSHHHGVAVWYK